MFIDVLNFRFDRKLILSLKFCLTRIKGGHTVIHIYIYICIIFYDNILYQIILYFIILYYVMFYYPILQKNIYVFL